MKQNAYPKTWAYSRSRITREYSLSDQMRDELIKRIHFLEDQVSELQMFLLQQSAAPEEPNA